MAGAVLAGGPYDRLHELASSADPLRRRTAMTAPLWFVKHGSDADLEPVVHRAVGIWLAHAGDRLPDRLRRFLREHEPAMARPAARLARGTLAAA